MAIKIQFKRGTATRWQTKNPILDAGEPGFELDTGKLKIGDGSTHWNDLEYIFDPELSNIEDQTLLDKIKNVDGSGSGLDADLLDGHDSSYFANASLSNVDDQTILDKIKNVDGSGSGLDADLLDGLDSSQFVRSDVDDDVNGKLTFKKSIHVIGTNNQRVSTIPGTGAIELAGGISSAIFSVQDGSGRIQLKWNATYGTNETFLVGSENAAKWEFDPNDSDSDLFKIYFGDGSTANSGDSITWEDVFSVGITEFTYKGNKIWHEGNDGSGSGLDADLLDGLDSSSFVRTDATTYPINDNTYDIGDSTHRYANIYAVNFHGTATSATYADLAEKYTIKDNYNVGDVVCISSDENYDLEVVNNINVISIIGVISEKPAFLMNKELVDGTPVALKGRVKCKVKGPVKKGDPLISYFNGSAISIYNTNIDVNKSYVKIFAYSLENYDQDDYTLIDVIII